MCSFKRFARKPFAISGEGQVQEMQNSHKNAKVHSFEMLLITKPIGQSGRNLRRITKWV